VATAAVISARGPDPNAVPTAEAVEGRVMSTWCPGLTLAECPSGQASALRQKIAARVADGWTNRRIDAWLVDNYGEEVLGRPRSAAAFLVPAAAVLGGGLAVAFVVRRRPGPGSSPASPSSPPSSLPPSPEPGAGPAQTDAYRKRLEADLRRFAGEATE
jgi:cytochrome c-type biogenesis protein CcmH